MIITTTFAKVEEGQNFCFENLMYEKKKGTVTLRKQRQSWDYNAVDTKKGDFWEFDDADEVLLIGSVEA
jgi:hypothetical protein